MPDDIDDDLAFSIAFATSKRRQLLLQVPRVDAIAHLRPIAHAVIKQLRLSGYVITKKPPRPPHSASW
ncbi:MAG: hypothetical protein AAFX81_09090 [Pseudomonadota bacterium]